RVRASWSRLAWGGRALGVAAAMGRQGGSSSPAPREKALPLPGGVTAPKTASVAGPRFPRANVLVVSIDTLRRDHLAPYGAPFDTPPAARLAHEGIVFEHAASHIPVPLPAH